MEAKISKSKSAREFISGLKVPNPFNDSEIESLIGVLNAYASLKCLEQRRICADQTKTVDQYHAVLFAPEPKFEL